MQSQTEQPGAVDFPTERRMHVGLAVADVARSAEFYETLFAQAPSKRRPDYAKFELVDPPLNLSLVESKGAREPAGPGFLPSHFGIQVKSSEAVRALSARLEQAGLSPRMQEQVGCCYAVQDKAWVDDPDGHAWEIFVVTDNTHGALRPTPETGCCVPAKGATSCC